MSPQLFDLTLVGGYYSGDGMSHGFVIKTILDLGWFPVYTPWVGAPFGVNTADFPYIDNLNFLLIRLLGMFSTDWIVVSNLFYLASYFLAGLSAYVVFRRLGVASAWAIAGAILFAFLPYHWLRRGHLFLANYVVVPLGVWLAFIAWRRDSESPGFSPRYLVRALLVVLVGSGGAYYAAFSAFLVVVAGVGRALAERSARPGLPALAIVVGLTVVVGLNVVPSMIYRYTAGPNPQAASRFAWESEVYGLRLTQLVLPHGHHRVGAMRNVTVRYAASAPLVNENAWASLGVAGTAGLALLALVAVARLAGASASPYTMSFLALLAVACFIFGTIGGGGTLFALAVSPLLRGLNRISVFIGFIALAGLLLALQAALARSWLRAPLWSVVGAVGLAVVGILDQTPRALLVAQDVHLESDRQFIATAESLLPPGTLVWQLPYHPFPEAGPLHRMQDYGLIRGYLNSSTLRWSYGAMKGRPSDLWIRAVAANPLPEQLQLVARSGFGAVYIDRRAFADSGAAAEKTLREVLGRPLVESRDGMLALYRLTPSGTRPLPLEDVMPVFDAPIRFDVQHLSNVAGIEGLSDWEGWGRWSAGPVVRIHRRILPTRFVLRIETAMALPPSVGVDLIARIGDVERTFQVGPGVSVVEIPFDLPASANRIDILIPNPRSPKELGINEDPRKLGIGLRSMAILAHPGSS